jgi:uncharacterized protein (TIGR02145 family)
MQNSKSLSFRQVVPYLQVMQRLLSCFVVLAMMTASQSGWGQSADAFNPDSDGDGHIDLADLMSLLATYDLPWPPAVELDCGGGVEFEGYTYATVQIGGQCWFAENVRYLPEVFPPSQGWEDGYGAHAYVLDYHGYDVSAAQATSGYQTYGVIYDGPAIQTWTVCPSGWHLPTTVDWQTLLTEVGGQTEAGPALKASSGWNGTNSSGFNAKPGGSRSSAVGFLFDGSNAWFWGAEPFGNYSGQGMQLYTYANEAILDQVYTGHVRCVKD